MSAALLVAVSARATTHPPPVPERSKVARAITFTIPSVGTSTVMLGPAPTTGVSGPSPFGSPSTTFPATWLTRVKLSVASLMSAR